jgi:hypothetical protein
VLRTQGVAWAQQSRAFSPEKAAGRMCELAPRFFHLNIDVVRHCERGVARSFSSTASLPG